MKSTLITKKLSYIILLAIITSCGGSSASDQANRMAEYKAEEEGVPCPTFNAGTDVDLKNFSFKIISAEKVEVETRLPWIQNYDERGAFQKSGEQGLALQYQLKNNTPLAKKKIYNMQLITKSGDRYSSYPYNAALASKAAGFPDTFGKKHLPDSWDNIISVFPVSHEILEDAVLYFSHVKYELNEHGKKVRILKEHAVADLPAFTDGASLKQPGEGLKLPKKRSRRNH